MKQLIVGKVGNFCSCLTNGEHPTESTDKESCNYCGHHIIAKVITEVDVNRYERWTRHIKRNKIDIEGKKTEVFLENMETIRETIERGK